MQRGIEAGEDGGECGGGETFRISIEESGEL